MLTTLILVGLFALVLGHHKSHDLHPNGDNKWCLDVQGAVFANNTPVQLYRCNKTPAQKFTFQNHKGVTKIQVGEEKDYCLNRENWNQPSRFVIRPCNEGPRFPTNLDMFENPREEYVEGVDNPYSSPGVDPNRIVLWWSADTACPGEDPVNCHPPPTCVDLPDGKKENGARIQTWQCFHGNTNQRWTATEHK